MAWDYMLMDVFTETPFGGNQLAVFADSRGIPAAAMPLIARELNLSETVFAEPVHADPHAWRVRIFTPAAELPFAGHPTIGTAAALVHAGLVPVEGERVAVTLHEAIGPVPVEVALSNGQVTGATLSTPRPPAVREAEASRETLAAMLGLSPEDFDDVLAPRAVGWETAFHVVAVRNLAAANRAALRHDVWKQALGGAWAKEVYVLSTEVEGAGCDIHARMFAPALGIVEDPATGSAAAALAGYMAAADGRGDGPRRWRVEQGIEMGRPSLIDVQASVTGGIASGITVGGRVVMMGAGRMEVGTAW